MRSFCRYMCAHAFDCFTLFCESKYFEKVKIIVRLRLSLKNNKYVFRLEQMQKNCIQITDGT